MEDNEYRVIEILNTKALLVNYGKTHGAKEGKEIRIIIKGPEVIDPLTKESLGRLDTIKETLTIVAVYDNFSLCKKLVTTTTNAFINPLTHFQTTSVEIKDFNADKNDISNRKFSEERIIKTGDTVIPI